MFAAIFPLASDAPAAAGAGALAAGGAGALDSKKAARPSLPKISLSTEIYNELIVYIFYFLSTQDLNQTSLVCRNWHVLSQTPYSWKKRTSLSYGIPLLSSSPATQWRKLYVFHGIKAALDRGIFEDPATHQIRKQLVTSRGPDAKMQTPPLPATSLATKCLGRTEDASYSFALIESGVVLQTDSTTQNVKTVPTLFSQKDHRLAKCILQTGIPFKAQNGHLAICYLEDASQFHVEIMSYSQILESADPSTHVFRTFSLKHTFVRMRITESLMCILTNSKVVHWNWKTKTSPHEMSHPPIEQLVDPLLEDITAFEVCEPNNGVTLIEYRRKHLKFMKWNGFISRMCGSIQFEPGESFLAQHGNFVFSTKITKKENVQKVTIQAREMVLKGIIFGDYEVKSIRVIEDVVAKGRFKPEIFDRVVGMCTQKAN